MAFVLIAIALIAIPLNAKADSNRTAKMFVYDLVSQAQRYTKSAYLSEEEKRQGLHHIFTKSFEIRRIGKFILGRHWKRATADQRQRFLEAFTAMTVQTYAPMVAKVPVSSFTVKRVQSLSKGDILIHSIVSREDGPDIKIVWKIVPYADSIYRILDVQVEGISLIMTLRSEYASVIRRAGGLDNLIDTLWAKVEKLQKDVKK